MTIIGKLVPDMFLSNTYHYIIIKVCFLSNFLFNKEYQNETEKGLVILKKHRYLK